jgi:hypothetical protein
VNESSSECRIVSFSEVKKKFKDWFPTITMMGYRSGGTVWPLIQNYSYENGQRNYPGFCIKLFNFVPFVKTKVTTGSDEQQQLDAPFLSHGRAVRAHKGWTAAGKRASCNKKDEVYVAFTFVSVEDDHGEEAVVYDNSDLKSKLAFFDAIKYSESLPNVPLTNKQVKINVRQTRKQLGCINPAKIEHRKRCLNAAKEDGRVEYTSFDSYEVFNKFLQVNSEEHRLKFRTATSNFSKKIEDGRASCSQYTEVEALLKFARDNDQREQQNRVLVWVNRQLFCPYAAFAMTLSAHSGEHVCPTYLQKTADNWLQSVSNWGKRFGYHPENSGSILLSVRQFIRVKTKCDENQACLDAIAALIKLEDANSDVQFTLLSLRCMAWTILWGKVFRISGPIIYRQCVFHPLKSFFANNNLAFLRSEYMTVYFDITDEDDDVWLGECGMTKFLKIWS